MINTGIPMRRTLIALVAVTVLVAGVSFALTAYGLFGYGREVWKLPILLAVGVPLMVDLQSICAGIATYALRNAQWRTRGYVWLVFICGSVFSVLGNEAFAQYRHLTMYGRIGSALPPIFLASAVHLVIVVRRHLERIDKVKPEPAPAALVTAPPTEPVGTNAPRVAPAPEQAPVAYERTGSFAPPAVEKPTSKPRGRKPTPAPVEGPARDAQDRVVGTSKVPAREVPGEAGEAILLVGEGLKEHARVVVRERLAAGKPRKGMGVWLAGWYDPPMSERWGQERVAEVPDPVLADARGLELIAEQELAELAHPAPPRELIRT